MHKVPTHAASRTINWCIDHLSNGFTVSALPTGELLLNIKDTSEQVIFKVMKPFLENPEYKTLFE